MTTHSPLSTIDALLQYPENTACVRDNTLTQRVLPESPWHVQVIKHWEAPIAVFVFTYLFCLFACMARCWFYFPAIMTVFVVHLL